MASTPVEFFAPTGLTLTLKLFPYGSDIIANGAGGDAATEATNRKGLYSATVTESISGWHTAHVVDGSGNLIAVGDVYLEDDTDIHRVEDAPQRGYDERDGFNVKAFGGTAGTFASGRPEVNTSHVAGTVQTAGDIIGDTNDLQTRLPAALTSNGNMKSSLMEILTTVLTETSGLIAGGFKKFFNVASPTGTVNSLPDAIPTAQGGLKDLLEADIVIDKTVTPWALVYKLKGTSTELLRKRLKDVNGVDLAATTTVVGQQIQ